LVGLLPGPLAGQSAPLEGFRDYVAAGVEAWEVPGLAVAVVKDGELRFAEGFGVRRLGTADPVGIHTLFAIGSTTKAMTAAALGMLVDEGKLDWDDRVIDHLPRFRLHDPYVTREIRVRDLLTHRAGLGNADFLWYEQETTTEEVLRRIRYAAPAYSFRAGYTYQNIMYAAAGQVVAAVSGVPWADFVQRRIFDPLGMDGSIPTMATLSDQPDVALPHDMVGDELTVIENASVDPVAAAGSVWSSVHDMARWMTFLLEGGVTDGGERLLSDESYAELFKPHTIIPVDQFYPTARLTRPHWTTYGLGWFQHDYGGRPVDFHTGSIDGMVAIHGLIREENLGVYVLANRDHAELRHALMYRVFDLFGDGAGRDWSADLKELYDGLAREADEARARAEAERVAGTSPSLDEDAYVGHYEDRLHGAVTVSRGGAGGLRLEYGPGLQGALEHWHHDTFRVTWDAGWRGTSLVTFRLDEGAHVSRLELGDAAFARLETQQ
jgi:CubicO group peptidase (beta-lactamase class C family)